MSDETTQSMRDAIGVLICDDNEAMRALLRVVVELRPTLRVVGEAADGHDAIREATRLQPDVVLLDLAMPRRTGLDVLPEILQQAPHAKIIVFSGFSTASVAEGAIDLGAIRYLTKGADPEVINDAIEEVVAEGKRGAPVSAPALLHRPSN